MVRRAVPDLRPLARVRRTALDELGSTLFSEDQPLLTAWVTACLVDGKPIDGEFRIVRADGRVRTLHMRGEPVLDSDGCTASMWAVLRDVVNCAGASARCASP